MLSNLVSFLFGIIASAIVWFITSKVSRVRIEFPKELMGDSDPVDESKYHYNIEIINKGKGELIDLHMQAKITIKMYDLGPEDDPAGIPRSDFEQDGFHYTLTDLLKQELPANESRQHTETVSVPSQSKDMGAVLALLPQTKEFITDDGLSGVLTLKLDTVNVEVSGYGSTTRSLTATRTYPGLSDQDTQYIPKSVEDGGSTLTLQTVNWQTGGDGRFTAVATYTGTATSSYVKGYTVTADYIGTVSRINLNKIRYVAIFEGTPLEPVAPEEPEVTPTPDLTDTTDPADQDAPTMQEDPTGEKNTLLPVVAVIVVVVLGEHRGQLR